MSDPDPAGVIADVRIYDHVKPATFFELAYLFGDPAALARHLAGLRRSWRRSLAVLVWIAFWGVAALTVLAVLRSSAWLWAGVLVSQGFAAVYARGVWRSMRTAAARIRELERHAPRVLDGEVGRGG